MPRDAPRAPGGPHPGTGQFNDGGPETSSVAAGLVARSRCIAISAGLAESLRETRLRDELTDVDVSFAHRQQSPYRNEKPIRDGHINWMFWPGKHWC
jgi:hypothetical protein